MRHEEVMDARGNVEDDTIDGRGPAPVEVLVQRFRPWSFIQMDEYMAGTRPSQYYLRCLVKLVCSSGPERS